MRLFVKLPSQRHLEKTQRPIAQHSVERGSRLDIQLLEKGIVVLVEILHPFGIQNDTTLSS